MMRDEAASLKLSFFVSCNLLRFSTAIDQEPFLSRNVGMRREPEESITQSLSKPLPIWLLSSPCCTWRQCQPYCGEHPPLLTGRAASHESNWHKTRPSWLSRWPTSQNHGL